MKARTVHSAKGESHPAVMLVAARAAMDRDNAREWIKAQIGDALDEETRVGCVAITRAHQEVIDAYLNAGFVLRE